MINYLQKTTDSYIQSNLPKWSPLLSNHLSLKVTFFLASDNKVYQLLAHGQWFSPRIPASSTTKTGRHDIAEILLKVALKHNKSINQSIYST
jgi:hypothetical protein